MLWSPVMELSYELHIEVEMQHHIMSLNSWVRERPVACKKSMWERSMDFNWSELLCVSSTA